jgi:hypothetical protein
MHGSDQVGAHNVAHGDQVACLPAVSEDRRRLILQQPADEDRHGCMGRVWTLAGRMR